MNIHLPKILAISILVTAMFAIIQVYAAPSDGVGATVSFPITYMSDTTASHFASLLSSPRQILAEYVSPTSALIGDNIDSITLHLQKVGVPTGTAQVGIFNTDLSVKKLFGIIDVSTISTTPTDYEFKLPVSDPLYAIVSGDRIGIKYTGGSATVGVNVTPDRDAADPFNGTSSYRVRYESTWITSTSEDMYMILKQTHASGTAATDLVCTGCVDTSDIANGAVTNAQLGSAAAIAFSKLATGLLPLGITVNSANIVDGSITKSDISAGSGIVTGAQACLGKVVTGIDSSGNLICKSISFTRDVINTPDKSFDAGGYTSIARGADGFAVISYYEIFGALEVVHCTDALCSTHDVPVTVDSSGNVGSDTSIAISTDGFPVISYYDIANGGLKAVHCTNKSCSTHDAPVTIDLGNVGQYTSIAIGNDGLPVIHYYDSGNGDLKVVHCASASCITYLKLTLDSTGNVGLYTSIAIGTDGFPVISYFDSTNGDLKIVHCTSAACLSQDSPIPLDSTGDVGLYTSIAIGTDGFPVISYHDFINGTLKAVHCTTKSCSTHDTPVIIDQGNVGKYTSIDIGTDGLPVISYYDSGNGDLKAVHCLSAACSTHDIPAVLDSTGDVGYYTSIAITAGNFPMISYHDSTNGFLKVAIMGGIALS